MKNNQIRFFGGPWDGLVITSPIDVNSPFITHDSADTGKRVNTIYRKTEDGTDGIPCFVFDSERLAE